MEYEVSRTSVWSDGPPPCEGAYRKKCVRVDRRATDDPAKVAAYRGETLWWTKEGRNHRIENGEICRDYDHESWFIEIPDLVAFSAKHGQLVLSIKTDRSPSQPSVEIYDEYRE